MVSRAEIESWLQSNRVDRTADYVQRGRRHADLSTDGIIEAWKSAFIAMAHDPQSQSLRAEENDLSSEIELRGLEVPYFDVGAAIGDLNSKVLEAAEELKKIDPEGYDEESKAIAEAFTKFKNQPKN